MPEKAEVRHTLSELQARQLATVTKTAPMMQAITPRWLVNFLQDYLDEIGLENISRYEHELLEYGTAGLLTVPGLRLIGTAREKASLLSFVLDGMPTEEIGWALDQEGIAVRAGHHCAQPILRRLKVEKSVRASLALYNTREDIDALVAALQRLQAGRGHRG